MAIPSTKRAPNRSATTDIIRIILARAVRDAQERRDGFKSNGSQADVANVARLSGAATALTSVQRTVLDYLDHGKLPLE